MSSYLNFYLVPKEHKEGDKPLLFTSYSRSNPVYQRYWEDLHPAYAGNEDKYTELTPEMANSVFHSAKEELDKTKESFNNEVEAFQHLKNVTTEQVNEYIQNYKDSKQCIQELEEEVTELEVISQWVAEMEYSDFEKVLINID
jgi:DNA repair exonuclease SbcCD ATPase subunit